jgi:hypothetical protein
MTHEEYVAHWRDKHAPLFSSQPDTKRYVRRYIQSRILPDRPEGGPGSLDGALDLAFALAGLFRFVLDLVILARSHSFFVLASTALRSCPARMCPIEETIGSNMTFLAALRPRDVRDFAFFPPMAWLLSRVTMACVAAKTA